HSPRATAAVMGLLGIGIGLTLPASIVAVQSAVAPKQVGIATALSALFRTLGGAIGIAILTSVLFAQVRANRGIAPGDPTGPLTDVPAATLVTGFQGAFVVGIAVAALALLIAWFLPERSLLPARGTRQG